MNVEKVLSGEYKGQEKTEINFRRGRSADDLNQSSASFSLLTVQKYLSSFCRTLACKLEERLGNEKDHKSTELIKYMGKCLSIKDLLEMSEDNEELNVAANESLTFLTKKTKYDTF